MDDQATSFRRLKLEESEVDGIAFHVDEKNSNYDQVAWNFTIMKLNEEENRDFSHHELGFKYQILLYKDEEAEVFEAIIGDLKHYVSNMVGAKQEGLVIKKCKKSEEILNKIFRGRLIEALAARLLQVKQSEVL